MTSADHHDDPLTEPTITRAEVAPGHDGNAELFVEVTHPGGGRTQLTLDADATAVAFSTGTAGIVADLVGKPWHALVGGAAGVDRLTGRTDRTTTGPTEGA